MVDGIFAIAMTILILGINPPRPAESQAQAMLPGLVFDLVPQVFIFVVAFLILASFWLIIIAISISSVQLIPDCFGSILSSLFLLFSYHSLQMWPETIPKSRSPSCYSISIS